MSIVKGQNLSDQQSQDSVVLSVLTCGTGTSEVYQAFGHTAVRVKNFTTGSDIVYNYGMFNFYEEGFLRKFIQGKLLYFVGVEHFDQFIGDYLLYGRSIREQVLNLDKHQVETLETALANNALPENRYYLYDFIYNNCSTQPRDLIRKAIGSDFEFAHLSTENSETIREMIDRHMTYNEWLDFGIDLLLGARLDRKADSDTRMFLPYELMVEFDSTQYHGKPIVKDSRILYHGFEQSKPNMPSPDLVFWSILFLVLLLQIFFTNSTLNKVLSISFLTIVGIVGWILVFMWWGTDHYMTKWNFNLLWAMPLYFPLAFFIPKMGKMLSGFVNFHRIIYILLLVFWCCNPQQYHSGVIPIILILIWSLGVFISPSHQVE
ncbi:MAG: DUF4105 domain-containing protein [Chitinophagales bacterium]|nr:DUF4105 domain-containing protein [Chitinophagales bacterium]